MKKIRVKMTKPLYLGMSILDISKILMYEFWYNYIIPKYGDRAKLCYTDTDSFIIYIKTEDFFEDISNDVERWFDTSNYNENDKRPLPIGKNKKVPGLFKDELGGKIITEVVALRAKTYAYLNDKFELPDELYSVSDIQDYFEFNLEKHGENIDEPSVQIYVNKIDNRVAFKIKNGYSFELLTPETMEPLGSTENKITKDKNGENVRHLEITEVVLVHSNIVNNDYQQDSRVLHTILRNKPFGSLLEISPTNQIFLKTFNSEYDEIIV